MSLLIKPNSLVLFQGDSITMAGRNADQPADLGRGYAFMAASWFGSLFPEHGVHFVNRGISGNRVKDLEARWEADCLQLKPNVVTIMIGINDCWRRYDRNDPTSVEAYEAGYRRLLNQVRERTQAELILMEPFVLPHPEDREEWREDLDPKIQSVRRLAREFNTYLVPLDGLFAEASSRVAPSYWAGDGVHPTPAGHALIARAWLRTVGALG